MQTQHQVGVEICHVILTDRDQRIHMGSTFPKVEQGLCPANQAQWTCAGCALVQIATPVPVTSFATPPGSASTPASAPSSAAASPTPTASTSSLWVLHIGKQLIAAVAPVQDSWLSPATMAGSGSSSRPPSDQEQTQHHDLQRAASRITAQV